MRGDSVSSVLVLEDHPLVRQMLVLALAALGYSDVHVAGSGEEALAKLEAKGGFDVLICDIVMSGMDGLTFLRRAREVGEISAIILSSEIALDLRLAIQQLAKHCGYQVLGDLGKPYSREDLRQLLLGYKSATPRDPFSTVTRPSVEDIQRAISAEEFIPYYQPKFDIQTMRITGAEVLVRWLHPERGLVPPALFLEVVLEAGLIDRMSRSVVQQALGMLGEHRLGNISLAVNLDPQQLGGLETYSMIQDMLHKHRIPAQQLTIEITETGIIHAPITCIENLVRLRLLGCKISVDDFGTGHSSLQRICELPCCEIKLDASFIQSMLHNHRSLAAVDSLIRWAKALDVNVVAEGIETAEQHQMLQRLGCPSGQGYFFSRPLPSQDFIKMLASPSPSS